MRMPLLLLLSLIASATAPSNRHARRHPDQANISVRRWASVKDTAAHLGVTTRAIRLMVADGRLTQYNLGPRLVRFDLTEVDAAMTPRTGDMPPLDTASAARVGMARERLADKRAAQAPPTQADRDRLEAEAEL